MSAFAEGRSICHQKLFINLILEGKIKTAFQHIEIARQLDPLAVLNNYFTGYYYYVVEQFDESNYYLERTFEIEASFIVGYSIYGLSLVLQKRALFLLEKAESIPAMAGADVEKLIMQTLAYSSLKDTSNTNIRLKKLKEALHGESRERVRFFLIYIELFSLILSVYCLPTLYVLQII